MVKSNQKGVVLIAIYGLITVLLILTAVFFNRSIVEHRLSQRNRDAIYAFHLAEAGLNRVKRELYDAFRTYFNTQGGRSAAAFAWFDTLPDENKYVLPLNTSLGKGTYSVQILDVDASGFGQRDVTLEATGQVNGSTRIVTEVVHYGLAPSRVFDYAYFVNNFGWFYGGGITSNGDIRSNGNFSFRGNPKVNGDIYASVNDDLGASGDITGNSRNDSINYYRSHSPDEARPTNPTADPEDVNQNGILDPGEDVNGNGVLDDFSYENGYDGESERFAQQEIIEMPYLGNLQRYKDLAVAEGGTIRQGGTVLVDSVLDDNIVLIGTASNPIEINGPVVVTGDVLIKGVVTGQGTIYAGRNTHIIGNITYQNPPAWTKPDVNPSDTDADNATKDFLGLVARGNIVIGDYTRTSWKRNVTYYLRPPFTQAYKVDAADADIGYVSYYSDGDPYFDGDYTANDGGQKEDGTDRKFYESSYADNYVRSIAEPSTSIRRIDAVTYTNHAFTGRVGAFTMNGSIISRDEAIIYSGSINMNYDVRAKSMGDSFHLPRSLSLPRTVVLEE